MWESVSGGERGKTLTLPAIWRGLGGPECCGGVVLVLPERKGPAFRGNLSAPPQPPPPSRDAPELRLLLRSAPLAPGVP